MTKATSSYLNATPRPLAAVQAARVVVDCEVSNHGSIFTFLPITQAAKDWLAEFVSGECTWFGPALAVEHRYAYNLAEGMKADGLVLR